MKKFLLFTLLSTVATMSFQASAKDDKLIVVSGSESKEYMISNINKIVVSDVDIQIINSDSSGETFAFSEDIKILFSETSGVASITTKNTNLTAFVTRDGSQLKINGWDSNSNANLVVYSIDGSAVLTANNWNGDIIDISGLQSGIYIVSINNHTAKFRK